ncbi:hypothetical protein BU26DRAFT_566392 [Trematosphaeria pertusa]|uniref:Uncharacterized protein n=1 Tax=Trematosphaeria pertusa TaxID=390896 RepID=A0A6A6IBH2_9PLEO|nr:uncharacterized protein BU26DRAFT_566392 [Trematosphaeria pertusa]KAF2247408.1 hypothetical protein BU26DRAFT_566392 [Trematosphaeria pertusa]
MTPNTTTPAYTIEYTNPPDPPPRRRTPILPRDPNIPPSARYRKAHDIHTPPLPITFKWRCCQPSCNASALLPVTNSTTTTTHFVTILSPYKTQYSWEPAFRNHRCMQCGHAACAECWFLSVESEKCAWRGAGEMVEDGSRGLWERIGVWDSREECERRGGALRVDRF